MLEPTTTSSQTTHPARTSCRQRRQALKQPTQQGQALRGLGHAVRDDAQVDGEGEEDSNGQSHPLAAVGRQDEDEDVEQGQHDDRDDGVEDVEGPLPAEVNHEGGACVLPAQAVGAGVGIVPRLRLGQGED